MSASTSWEIVAEAIRSTVARLAAVEQKIRDNVADHAEPYGGVGEAIAAGAWVGMTLEELDAQADELRAIRAALEGR